MISSRGERQSSGRYGPKTDKMKWETYIQPAVFEIVCEGSGRRYIGASLTPNMRKASYFFNLRNIKFFDRGNIFFGVKAIMDDLEKYGFDSFYFEIIKTIPGATQQDLDKALEKIIKKYPTEQLYNKRLSKIGYARSSFTEIDDEMKQLEDKRAVAYAEMVKQEEIYKKVLAETRAEKTRLKTADITGGEKIRRTAEQSAIWRSAKKERDAAQRAMHDLTNEVILKNKQLISKYSLYDNK